MCNFWNFGQWPSFMPKYGNFEVGFEKSFECFGRFCMFAIQMVVHSRVEELPLRMLGLQPCANGKLAVPETGPWLKT